MKGREREIIKIIDPISSYPNHNKKFKKKIPKKFTKLKNTIRASLQAKIDRERPRKIENKNYRSDQFLPDPKSRIQKKYKKNS